MKGVKAIRQFLIRGTQNALIGVHQGKLLYIIIYIIISY